MKDRIMPGPRDEDDDDEEKRGALIASEL